VKGAVEEGVSIMNVALIKKDAKEKVTCKELGRPGVLKGAAAGCKSDHDLS